MFESPFLSKVREFCTVKLRTIAKWHLLRDSMSNKYQLKCSDHCNPSSLLCTPLWTCRKELVYPYKYKLAPSFRSKMVYRANCWDCNDFYIGKTKRRLRDRKTEHFKALTTNCHESAIADHVFLTNHRIKWDHFEILATGRSDMHCKIRVSFDP